ncbi:MAG: hypothetical protein ACREBC_12740, partial [Pyrinomonadaceae bacterium]
MCEWSPGAILVPLTVAYEAKRFVVDLRDTQAKTFNTLAHTDFGGDAFRIVTTYWKSSDPQQNIAPEIPYKGAQIPSTVAGLDTGVTEILQVVIDAINALAINRMLGKNNAFLLSV